jgi:hypothetical protein
MLAMGTGDTGLGGLARVLEGFGLGRGELWVGSGEGRVVGVVQEGRRQRRGSWVLSSSSSPSLTARVGAGEAGVDQGTVQKHGYRL